ncbi:MAG: hypothetical protein AAF356_02775 [Planctomycetota bacterium]
MNIFEMIFWTAALWAVCRVAILIADQTSIPLSLSVLLVVCGVVPVGSIVRRLRAHARGDIAKRTDHGSDQTASS